MSRLLKNYYIKLFCLLSFVLLNFSCEEKKEPEKIILEFPVISAVEANVPVIEEFVGQSYGYNDVAIRARVEGFLTGLHFQEGSFVKKGDLLYSIDPDPYAAKVAESKGKVAAAKTQLALAKADLDRIKPLAEIDAVSKSDLDAAQASYDAAQAQLEAERASLRFSEIELSYCTIRSPISGMIGKTEAKLGEFVGRDPNPVVLNGVSRIDTIQVRFSISERLYLNLARRISEIEKSEGKDDFDARSTETTNQRNEIELILADGSVYPHDGKFDFANRAVDPETGTLLLQVSFPNPNNILLPGQFARVRTFGETVKGAILIPQRCIKELQGSYQSFIVNENNEVELRKLEVSNKADSLWVVNSGLKAGERVIYDGIQKVSPGMVIKPKMVELKVSNS